MNFFFQCLIFLHHNLFLARVRATAVRAAVEAKLAILGVLSSISLILALKSVFLRSLLISME